MPKSTSQSTVTGDRDPVDHLQAAAGGLMMPSAECAAGIDDEGRAARRRLGGVVRGFDEEAPGDDGLKARLAHRHPILIAQWFEVVRRAKRTKRADPCHRNGIRFALKIGFE